MEDKGDQGHAALGRSRPRAGHRQELTVCRRLPEGNRRSDCGCRGWLCSGPETKSKPSGITTISSSFFLIFS